MKEHSVMVGMSGGVDSAVAADILQSRGYAVAGLFMKNWEEDDGTEYCTAQEDFEDAARVCDILGIELFSANFASEYWDSVFERFLAAYTAGLTPNPDILCNREIKFNVFIDYAEELGYPYVATGHYARRDDMDGVFRLLKGTDGSKDQTYFLQAVPREQLARCLFPVGNITKDVVRKIARDLKLAVHNKKDSTGICFIGERRFRDFLSRYVKHQPGEIVDDTDTVRGEHVGLSFYTLGQRQGLGIGGQKNTPEKPWYVLSKDLEHNRLVVTQDEAELYSSELTARGWNWISADGLRSDGRYGAKVRHRQLDQACTVHRSGDDEMTVVFDHPQRAVTPGQYVALYDGEECIGGGEIVQTKRASRGMKARSVGSTA